MILTITDNINNGKGNNIKLITFGHHCFAHEINIINNKLIINLDLKNIKKIIFNFNEDYYGYYRSKINKKKFKTIHKFIDHLKEISNIIKSQYPTIIIYNDPIKCINMGNKFKTYNDLKAIESEFFKIPKYDLLDKTKLQIDYFPCIVKRIDASHDTREAICHNEKELTKQKKVFGNAKIISLEYIDSYVSQLHCYCALRLMVVDNKLIDYFLRPSNGWNIHNCDQDKNLMIKADKYFETFYIKNKSKFDKLLNDLYMVYGNGFFSYDLILNQDKLYLCVTGLKYYDYSYHAFIKKKSVDLDKNHCNLCMLRQLYEEIIMNNNF